MAALRVLVGSTNKAKLEAVRRSFASAFKPLGRPIEVVALPAESGVSAQPMGDGETRQGAFTRAQTAAQQYGGPAADFAVGLEGGIVDTVVPLPPFLPGSGGLTARDMSCFAWMCVLHIPTQRWGFARTASFSLPPPVASLVRGGMELGDADDAVFGRSGSKQEEGAVGILTHGAITRATYYEHALLLALAPFVHEGEGGDLHMRLPAPHRRGSTGSIPRGLYSAVATSGGATTTEGATTSEGATTA